MTETLAEEIRRLQSEIAERQARLQFLVLGDPRVSVNVQNLAYPAPQLPEGAEAMTEQRKPGARWRHVKRASTYTLICEAHLQTGEPIDEPAIMVVYRADSDGEMWVRPRAEFLDGRFEALTAHPPGEVSEDVVERVAEAIYNADDPPILFLWQRRPPVIREIFYKRARAAIAALPTLPELHEGHDRPCRYCGERCNALAGNASL